MLAHADSDFSEFVGLSEIIQELRDILGMITVQSKIDVNFDELEVDVMFDDRSGSTWVKDIDILKNEELDRIWAVFEERLEFLAQAVNEHDFL